jgi:hypothetical protein
MESGSGMDQWAGRQAWRGKGPVGCVEACLDEILALGLGDALGDREGARRMGGRGRGLGHPGSSRVDVGGQGGDCEPCGGCKGVGRSGR